MAASPCSYGSYGTPPDPHKSLNELDNDSYWFILKFDLEIYLVAEDV